MAHSKKTIFIHLPGKQIAMKTAGVYALERLQMKVVEGQSVERTDSFTCTGQSVVKCQLGRWSDQRRGSRFAIEAVFSYNC